MLLIFINIAETFYRCYCVDTEGQKIGYDHSMKDVNNNGTCREYSNHTGRGNHKLYLEETVVYLPYLFELRSLLLPL